MTPPSEARVPPNPWGARNPVHALVLSAACTGLGLCPALALLGIWRQRTDDPGAA